MGEIDLIKTAYGFVDKLTIVYNGNQLITVGDSISESTNRGVDSFFIDGVDDTEEYTYDANGNPTSITRSGITEKNGSLFSYGTIDQMNLSYNGNQLKKIDDTGVVLSYVGAMDFSDGSTAASEYTWDKNGNMTRDLNHKISQIQYNSLFLE